MRSGVVLRSSHCPIFEPQGALPLRRADVQGEGLCQEGGDDQAQQVAPEDGRGTQVRLQVGIHLINHQISMIIIHLFQIIPLKDLRGLTKVYIYLV